jgi:ketosteroid isomerase-like protein
MRRSARLLLLVLGLLPGAARGEPRSAERDRAALAAIEQAWLSGSSDAATLSRILADDFVHVLPTGDMVGKEAHIHWATAHPPPPGAHRRFDGLRVRVYGDVGVVTGAVVSRVGNAPERRNAFTDVFVYRADRWQAVSAQETMPVAAATSSATRSLSHDDFDRLMQRLANAWNQNDARRAADCFTDDARYSAPPDPRVRRGRDELFHFFGGDKGRPRPMHMQWHHLVFDEERQLGAGEYTFDYDTRSHGVVIVRIVDGRIAQWREWEHASPLSFDALTKDNAF